MTLNEIVTTAHQGMAHVGDIIAATAWSGGAVALFAQHAGNYLNRARYEERAKHSSLEQKTISQVYTEQFKECTLKMVLVVYAIGSTMQHAVGTSHAHASGALASAGVGAFAGLLGKGFLENSKDAALRGAIIGSSAYYVGCGIASALSKYL
jgi:hypothetical protein